jgi:hypothetical protein
VEDWLLSRFEVHKGPHEISIVRHTAEEVLRGAGGELARRLLDARVNILDPNRTEKGAELLEWVRLGLAGEELLPSLGLSGLGKMIQNGHSVKLCVTTEVAGHTPVDAHGTCHLKNGADGDLSNTVELGGVGWGSMVNYPSAIIELTNTQGIHVGGSVRVENSDDTCTAGLSLLLIYQDNPSRGILGGGLDQPGKDKS